MQTLRGFITAGVLLLLVVAPAWAAPPHVQQIHKCRVDGVATFQAHPCAARQAEQAWEIDMPPSTRQHDRPIEAIRRELRQRARELDRQRAPPPRAPVGRPRAPKQHPAVRGHLISVHQHPRQCAAARRQREVAYQRAGMARRFALSRRMDDRVYAACR